MASDVRSTTIIRTAGRPVAVHIRKATATVVEGPDSGTSATFAGRIIRIGAHPSNDLALAGDRGVSSFHCQLEATEHGYRVIDRDSANGTFIDGVRIQRAFLSPGQSLSIGHSRLMLAATDDEINIDLSPSDYFGEMVGRSIAMRELFAVAERVARTNATILIGGETGTGKDVLARAIHRHSPRAKYPFEVFDCGAVTANLIEAALFGHVKGAFTGAVTDSPGVFERANGGSVFLDEIGELAGPLQPRLLRVLESGTVQRVGGTNEIKVDVRVLAATNRDLAAEVESGRFRSDLYFRLAVVPIQVPPLRERKEDIPLLAGHFLRHLLARDGTEAALLNAHIDSAFARLMSYSWPGNVRELRNVIERAAVLSSPDELGKDLFSRLVELKRSIGVTLTQRPPLKVAREQFDAEYLRDILEVADFDVNRAAALADVHPKSFSRLLRRYSIDRPRR